MTELELEDAIDALILTSHLSTADVADVLSIMAERYREEAENQ
jgi:hypothetical protein